MLARFADFAWDQSCLSTDTVCGVDPIGRCHWAPCKMGIGERQLMFDGYEELLHWLKGSNLVSKPHASVIPGSALPWHLNQ